MIRRQWTSLVLGLGLALPAALMGQSPLPAPTVLFAPRMQTALDTTYGPSEAAVLQRMVSERAGEALRGERCEGIAAIEITLLDARPTHPTDRQMGDNPALDRLRTHFAGGAAFSVRLLDAQGRELKSLRYDHYAQDLRLGSRAVDPWADVRLASEGLGMELAHTCRALARPGPKAS